MRAIARPILAGLLFAGLGGVASGEPGPRERECMVGEQRVEGECQPTTRGPKNRGS